MKCLGISKLICLLVLAMASVAMAAFGPVTSVVKTDLPAVPPSTYAQKILQSITIGTTTYSQLITGTSTSGTPSTTLQPRVDDLDLNTAITGFGTAGLRTVNFGGGTIFSTNGNKPDFFLFEGTSGLNPDDITVAAIFSDDTVGVFVVCPTGMDAPGVPGWGNTGLTMVGSVNNGQAITGLCWDISDLKDAAGNFLSPNAVIKGIAISPGGSIDPAMLIAAKPQIRGAAHTPVPATGSTAVDAGLVNSLSWYSPLQDSSGAPKADPNLVSVIGYDVYFGTDPNTNNLPFTQTTSQNLPVTLNSNTTYYWRVDTRSTWNKPGFPAVVKGMDWQFKTLPPTVTFNNVVTLQSLPAALSAVVTGTTSAVTSVEFSIQTQDAFYPAGAVATVTNTSVDNKYPTATLTTDTPGNYKVKLVIVAGTSTVEKVAEVVVYRDVDACAAKKAAGGWTANYYDQNGNCIVQLSDFAPLAAAWLNNTGLQAQQTYTSTVTYFPKDIWDARIEAESIVAPDPNWVSGWPLGDPGIRITDDAAAMGGKKVLGWTSAGDYAQYTINIAEAGTYDLHINTSAPAAGGGFDFGIAETPALYGSTTGFPGTGWGTYYYQVYPGALTFTSAGPTIVRITWTGLARNLDWFALIKQAN